MSTYLVFHNPILDKKLIYYPCPKNANTSAKMFFATHGKVNKKYVFMGDLVPEKNQKDDDFEGKKNIISFLPSKQPFEKRDVDLKCCIIRDPVKRFISAYKNRVLYHGDPGFNNHSIDMVLEKLEKNNYENKHFLPQSFFLGEDLSYYSFWATPENISKFVEKVNDFFGQKVEFPKIQTGGKEFKIKLESTQVQRIQNIYIKDYKLFIK
jgi:hypothetical protein